MVPYKNPANHAPGVQICHTLWVIFFPGLNNQKNQKNLWNHETITSGERYRLIDPLVVDYFAWIIGLKYVYSVIKGLSELKDQSSFIIYHQGYILTLCMLRNYSCFCCHLLTFFQNYLFQKIISGTLSVCQMVWIQIECRSWSGSKLFAKVISRRPK